MDIIDRLDPDFEMQMDHAVDIICSGIEPDGNLDEQGMRTIAAVVLMMFDTGLWSLNGQQGDDKPSTPSDEDGVSSPE